MGSGEQGLASVKSGTESGFAGELSKCLLYNGMLKKPRVPEVKMASVSAVFFAAYRNYTACVCSYRQYLLIRQSTTPIGQMPHGGGDFIDSRASLGL